MKLLKLAVVAAILGLPVTPVLASGGQGLTTLPVTTIGSDLAERRSGRCPGGESRRYVSGCSGV